MKKYLSCVILILLCVICAMVFYVNASSIRPPDDSTDTSVDHTTLGNGNDDSARVPVIDKSGTIRGEYFCDTNLRVEWSLCKYFNEDILYFCAEVYLDAPRGMAVSNMGYIEINGERTEFKSPSFSEGSVLVASCIKTVQDQGDTVINVSAHLDVNIADVNGLSIKELNAQGRINATEDYMTMSKSCLLDVEHVSQFPHLPSGDEITALGTVLKHLGYDVEITELCDLYLSKGPVGYTSFYKANVGNPRSQYNSYGCYAPVIIEAGEKYINANGGSSKVTDMSGYNTDELYRQVSLGNPIIVWLCEDFDAAPSISRIWLVDGETLYLKSGMACMVLIGYDYTRNTVTLSDPAGGVFSVDMNLFALKYAQMGSQAIKIG